MRNAAAGSMNHRPSQLRLAASVVHALDRASGAVGALRAMSVMANAPDLSPFSLHLPLEGGGRRALARREGVTAVPHSQRRTCCAAVTPPRTAFGSPTLPLQGRVKCLPINSLQLPLGDLDHAFGLLAAGAVARKHVEKHEIRHRTRGLF